jgi:phosphoribosylformylglycinamidine synthase
VQGALRSLGFGGVEEVHVGRLIRFTLAAGSEGEAQDRVEAMCRQLLANPVTEDYDVRVEALAAA